MPEYIWPLSKSAMPDEMNTSFGPRINRNQWDFHDGIDLPAPIGTSVYAMRGGEVHDAGAGGTGGYRSRHVVIESDDPADGRMYHVYLHLDEIDPAVTKGASIEQGQKIGAVGDDDATYPHLHMEFRKGTPRQIGSVHPLEYLPYPDTVNFSPAVLDRVHRSGEHRVARLLFGAPSKLEGDLKRVEVDLRARGKLLETRIVDFDDKATVNEGNGDEHVYVNDIGVEGYQKSNMVALEQRDLKYGILIRNIPADCDVVVARIIDVAGNTVSSPEIALPNPGAIDEYVPFDGDMPPAGWAALTSSSGSGTSIDTDTVEDHPTGTVDAGVMICVDASTSEADAQRAAIEYALPGKSAEWAAEAWFNPVKLGLYPGQRIDLLQFVSEGGPYLAAHLYKGPGPVWAGLARRNPDGRLAVANSDTELEVDAWRKWKITLVRVGTREATAVLYVDDDEQARVNLGTVRGEPGKVRAGIARSSPGATATVLTAELRIRPSSR